MFRSDCSALPDAGLLLYDKKIKRQMRKMHVPGVYAKVSAQLGWIKGAIGDNNANCNSGS